MHRDIAANGAYAKLNQESADATIARLEKLLVGSEDRSAAVIQEAVDELSEKLHTIQLESSDSQDKVQAVILSLREIGSRAQANETAQQNMRHNLSVLQEKIASHGTTVALLEKKIQALQSSRYNEHTAHGLAVKSLAATVEAIKESLASVASSQAEGSGRLSAAQEAAFVAAQRQSAEVVGLHKAVFDIREELQREKRASEMARRSEAQARQQQAVSAQLARDESARRETMLHRALEEKVSASERRLRAESDRAREDRLGQAEAVAELNGKVEKLAAAMEVLLRRHSDDAGRVDHESPSHPRTPPSDPPAHEPRAPVDPHAVGSAHGTLFTVPEEGYEYYDDDGSADDEGSRDDGLVGFGREARAGRALVAQAQTDFLSGKAPRPGTKLVIRPGPMCRPVVDYRLYTLPHVLATNTFDIYAPHTWLTYMNIHCDGDQSAQVARVIEKLRSDLPRPPQKEEAKLYDETLAHIKIEFGRYLAFAYEAQREVGFGRPCRVPRNYSLRSDVLILESVSFFENADAARRYCGPDAAAKGEIVSMDAPPMSHFMASARLEAERRHLQALANAKISGSTLPSGGATSGSAAASGSSRRRRRDDRRQQARPADSNESPGSQPPTVAKRTASPGKPPGNAKGREAK